MFVHKCVRNVEIWNRNLSETTDSAAYLAALLFPAGNTEQQCIRADFKHQKTRSEAVGTSGVGLSLVLGTLMCRVPPQRLFDVPFNRSMSVFWPRIEPPPHRPVCSFYVSQGHPKQRGIKLKILWHLWPRVSPIGLFLRKSKKKTGKATENRRPLCACSQGLFTSKKHHFVLCKTLNFPSWHLNAKQRLPSKLDLLWGHIKTNLGRAECGRLLSQGEK